MENSESTIGLFPANDSNIINNGILMLEPAFKSLEETIKKVPVLSNIKRKVQIFEKFTASANSSWTKGCGCCTSDYG
jgi:hypothetical protein